MLFLHISPSQDGAQHASFGSQHQAHPDYSCLATRVVSRPHTSDSGHIPAPSTSQGFTLSTSRAPVPSSSPCASSNHLETIKQFLHHRGYSLKVRQFLAKSNGHSTSLNYQYKWQKYKQWCKREDHTASIPSSQKFADFIVFFHLECILSTFAIKGFKAMLYGIFHLKALICAMIQFSVSLSKPAPLGLTG